MLNYQALCESMVKLTKETALFIEKNRFHVSDSQIETKSLNSLVSFVDKGAEEMLVVGLKKILPEAGFIAEEGTETTKGEKLNWIIDPLDGTTNFLHNIPVFAISIALMEEDEIVAGVVYEIGQKECFYAWKNGGAFLNDKPIKVSQKESLSDTLIATGFPYYDFERLEEFIGIIKSFIHKTRGLRRMGSAATDLAYVACGRFDGFFEYGLSPWDVAAGVILVKEAGGVVCDYSLGDDYLFGGEIAATSAKIHLEFMELIKAR
tara:strand:- start:62374 stop:63162 length:789 start_codon:yes stop_codon:yes gene_type:complete